jgi:hypothetical protein
MARITQWSGRNVSLLTDELCENIFQQAGTVLGLWTVLNKLYSYVYGGGKGRIEEWSKGSETRKLLDTMDSKPV